MSTTIPTVNELAMIAATLAHGRTAELKSLADDAYSLWSLCYVKRVGMMTQQQKAEAQNIPPASKPPFDDRPQFPVTLDNALRLWLPGVKEPDRWRDYRRFVEHQTQWDQEWAKYHGHPAGEPYSMEREKATPFTEVAFSCTRDLFLQWRAMQISAAKSKSGRAGAKARAAQQRRAKKRLTR